MQASPAAHASKRVAYFDLLRILAACSVVLLHVSAQNWDAVSVDSGVWQIFNITNSFSRWAVPVFLMISGALFLDNDRPLDGKKLLRVQILRLITAFCFWSAVYALDRLFRGASPRDALRAFLEGKYHMWYLFTMAGLYLVTPLVRRITESRQLTRYYLGIAFLFVILIPRGLHLLSCLQIGGLAGFLPEIQETLSQFHFSFGQIYLFYYVWGFCLARYGLPQRLNKVCYFLGILGYLGTVGLTRWYSLKTGAGVTAFYALNSLNVLCMSTALFLFARNVLSRLKLSHRAGRAVGFLSKCTFGIYLVHPLVLDWLERLGLHTLSCSPVLSVPGITVLVLVISCLLSALLRKIPVVNTYVV